MYGIVTYHDGFNFGAYLQVYALQHFLALNGIDSEILNYKSRKHWFNEYKCVFYTKNPDKLLKNFLKMLKFKKEQRKFKQTAFTHNAGKFNQKKYEAVVFGSDEIWNYENPLLGKDLFYFGNDLCNSRLISYAPSFGAIAAGKILPVEIVQLLKRFDMISVRDGNSAQLIENNIGIKPTIVVDPTLLYDFDGEEKVPSEKNYILVYTTGVSSEIEAAIRRYAQASGKFLVSVGWYNSFCDKNIVGIGPFEFLGYMKHANIVITSMFHGTLFSLKYKKEFCLLVDPYRTNKLSIIKTLGLNGRIVHNHDLEAVLNKPIDYEYIDGLLERQITSSKDYLLRALKGR